MDIIITGIDGAMGQILARTIAAQDDMQVIAGVTPTGADGAYLKPSDYTGPADMVIDFSHHNGTKPLMDYCVERSLPVVVCTTGQTDGCCHPETCCSCQAANGILVLLEDDRTSTDKTDTANHLRCHTRHIPTVLGRVHCTIEAIGRHHHKQGGS